MTGHHVNADLFGSGASDLPLLSGSPRIAEVDPFGPVAPIRPAGRQLDIVADQVADLAQLDRDAESALIERALSAAHAVTEARDEVPPALGLLDAVDALSVALDALAECRGRRSWGPGSWGPGSWGRGWQLCACPCGGCCTTPANHCGGPRCGR